jgi:membrane protease YdiL (CAAX protease family)
MVEEAGKLTEPTPQTQTRTRIGWHPITLALVLVVALSLLRAGAAFAMRRLWGSTDFEPSPQALVLLLIVFLIGSVGIVGGGLSGLAGVSWNSLGWRREKLLKEIGRGILAFIVVSAVAGVGAIVGGLLLGLELPAEMPESPPTLPAIAMSVCFGFLVAAWQEENLFRGYLQPLLIERWGYWPGIIAQAALFSIAHMGWYPTWPLYLLAFFAGIVFGWLRGRDRSLIPAFVAHGLLG